MEEEERKTPSQLREELAGLRSEHESLKKAHAALKRDPLHVEEILETMSDHLLVLSPDTTIQRTNRATLDLLGYRKEEVVGGPLLKILGDRSLQARQWTELLAGEEVRDFELTLRTKVGESVPITFNGAVIRSADGKVLGTVCVGRDLRVIKKLLLELQDSAEAYKMKADELNASRAKEQELQRELSQAEKLAALGELAGGMAHEINGPLMVISGNAEMLNEAPGLTDQTRDRIKSILKASRRCGEIVGKLHSFARTDFTKVEACSVNECIEDVISLFDSALTVENVITVKELEKDLPGILANRGELHQIFTNLVLNAKDAMSGGGMLTLRTRRDGNWVEAEVADTGVGIPQDNLDRIFDPFFTTKDMGRGTGLGLSLTRNMMKRARGEIRVRSLQGEGTSFVVRFPLEDVRTERAPERPAARPVTRRLKVLVVDDEESIRYLCRDFLAGDGHESDEARNAEEALGKVQSSSYDLVITDLKMPGIGGFSLLKSLNETNPQLPALVMTGSIFTVHEEVGNFPNVLSVLRKPFGRGELRNSLERLTQHQTRMLIVDDDKIFVRTLVKQLQSRKLPMEIVTAHSALEAGQRMELMMPDVVVLDLMMSSQGIDGVEICWALKSVPRTRGIMVIIVTGVTDPEILNAARGAGADHVLQKPVDVEQLVALLGPVIAQQETAVSAG